jgi:uncharacterized protein YjbI with pentapeptide repeats
VSDTDRVWKPSEIIARYARGERDFRELEIEDTLDPVSFRGAVLDGSNFTGSVIVADFTGASLRACTLSANVKTCAFDRADLSRCDFSHAALCATSFREAKLDDATFDGAFFHSRILQPGERPDW